MLKLIVLSYEQIFSSLGLDQGQDAQFQVSVKIKYDVRPLFSGIVSARTWRQIRRSGNGQGRVTA